MYSVIKDVFSAAVRGQPPAAIAPCNQVLNCTTLYHVTCIYLQVYMYLYVLHISDILPSTHTHTHTQTHAHTHARAHTQSRAIYGVDMMLKWSSSQSIPSPPTPNKKDDPSSKSLNNEREMEPQLLEVNYCPDCIRACKYHPQFFNHVFQTLFDVEGGSPLRDVPVTRLI